MNISDRIRNGANRFPERAALIFPKPNGPKSNEQTHTLTFRQLDLESDVYAWDLLERGIIQGTRTILIMRNTPELYIHIFALFKIGAVPIVVDPGIGIKRVLRCYRSVKAEAFIGITAAHFLQLLNPFAFSHVKVAVGVSRRKLARFYRFPFPIAPVEPQDLLMINFTTGSTGPPKGVEYTHAMAEAMVRQIQAQFKQDENSIDVATLPLFALFDVLMHSTSVLPVLCTSTQPSLMAPKTIIDLIHSFQATHIFASPAFLKNLGDYGNRNFPQIQLPSLKHVVSGGAPVSETIMANIRNMLSNQALIHSTYGATEAIPISSITDLELKLRQLGGVCVGGVCVGRPSEGIQLRLIKISNAPIPIWSEDLLVQQGRVGEITIAGPHVSQNYYLNPKMNELAKIQGGKNEIWHRTGDLGWIDEDQKLWFCGRKKHRVNTAQGPLYSVQIESFYNTHPKVYRSALVGIGSPECQTPIICVELKSSHSKAQLKQIETELQNMSKQTALTSTIQVFLFHPGFPVDIRHNAKIDREQLSHWAHLQLSSTRKWIWIPIAGWIFIFFGLLFPMNHPLLNWLWRIDIFLSVVVHGLQLFVTLPFGKKAGIPLWKTFGLTLLCGATVWKPAFDSKFKSIQDNSL